MIYVSCVNGQKKSVCVAGPMVASFIVYAA